jgi:hypothetical protein
MLRFFYLPFLFFLPSFYAWLAFGAIQRVSTKDAEYRRWLDEKPIELRIPHASLHAGEDVDSESTQASSSRCPTLCLHSVPESLLDIRAIWNTFIDARLAELKTAVTIASVFVACVCLILCRFQASLFS